MGTRIIQGELAGQGVSPRRDVLPAASCRAQPCLYFLAMSKVSSKSASVSPGKPQITSVARVRPSSPEGELTPHRAAKSAEPSGSKSKRTFARHDQKEQRRNYYGTSPHNGIALYRWCVHQSSWGDRPALRTEPPHRAAAVVSRWVVLQRGQRVCPEVAVLGAPHQERLGGHVPAEGVPVPDVRVAEVGLRIHVAPRVLDLRNE